MKSFYFFAVITCCLVTHLFGQATNQKLSIYKLTGDFYVYTTYKDSIPSNSMYLVTNKGIVMFDTPWDSTQFQPFLDSLEKRHHKKVILCISTHFHADRTAGLDFLKQKSVKTYSSKQTFDLCRERNEKQSQYYFTRDTTFITGNYSFQTYYPGEGHTKDNIIVWIPKEKIIYGGCLIKSTVNNSMGFVGDANIPAWPATIQKIISKFPDHKYVIPGHYSWESNGALEHTLELVKKN